MTNAPQRTELAPARREAAAPTAQPRSLTVGKLARATERTRWNLLDVPSKSDKRMPRIWQVVRTKIEDKMPTYRTERGTSVMLSPVVVISDAFDAAPAVGVVGRF